MISVNIVLIGGNPKGYDIPFHPETRSGKRLRAILEKHNLEYEITDMTLNRDDKPSHEEIVQLHAKYKDYKIVFLGRFVEKELREIFPDGIYLPHLASRRTQDLIRLENGLINLE